MEILTSWDCPVCDQHNVDDFAQTATPMCEACECTFEWGRVHADLSSLNRALAEVQGQLVVMPDMLATRYQAEQLAKAAPSGDLLLDWSNTTFIAVSAYDGLQQRLGRRFTHTGLPDHLAEVIAEYEQMIQERDDAV